MTKLNLGCGAYPLDGYTNVDLHNPAADINGDIRKLEFSGIDHIEMSHVLEHIPWQETRILLRRINGWLKPGGTIRVEVPDMAVIADYIGVHPHWVPWVYGSQEHGGEVHLSGFTELSLIEVMEATGYEITGSSTFPSEHEARPGFPCVSVEARRKENT